MRKEFIYKFCLVVCAALFSVNMKGQDTELVLGDLRYTLHEDGTATLVGVKAENPAELELGDVVIPATVSQKEKEYQVKEVGNSALLLCKKMTSITIPEGVITIGAGAFANCTELATITIPESIETIEKNAFVGTKWYDSMPDGELYIQKILYSYKGYMPKETSITIKDGTVSIAEWALANCDNLIAITFPSSLIKIGDYAFSGCKLLPEISLPEKLEYIGEEAFSGTAIKKLTIPASVTYIDGRFAPLGLEEIRFEGTTVPKTSSQSFIPDNAIYYVPFEAYLDYFKAGLIPFGTVENFSTVKTLEDEFIYPVTTTVEPDGVGGTVLLNGEKQSMIGAKEGTKITFEITADEGYRIEKVWVGTQLPIESDDLTSFTYTIPSLSNYTSMGVRFKSSSAISSQSTDDIRVYISEGTLKIENVNEVAPVEVLSVAGQTLYKGTTDNYENVSLPAGMYIVKVGTQTHKVMMK